VPNRRECKFHSANYSRQLNGCIALGKQRVDLDKDGYLDVSDSVKTMQILHKELSGQKEALLIVKNV